MSEPVVILRCAVHSGRAAHDRCPRCGRPRCDVDVETYGTTGCAACRSAGDEARQAPPLLAPVAAGLTIVPVAGVGGWIYSQYVEVQVFSWLVPLLIGVAASWSATVLWHIFADTSRRAILIGIVAALCGTALGFRLYPHGPHDPLKPWHVVGLPYLCTVVAAIVWPIVLGPPRRPDDTTEPID
ncbi:MAG TPA: hypothetical protein VHB18_02045 [Mycobacteriales bacterium]|nr:hypothetical protein [Mycobacteriales bacterium]